MSPIRILLADDHIVVREGTRQILEREPDLVVIGEANDGREAVALVSEDHPDVAIIDISMPIMNGIQATKGIKAIAPETAVLVLTAYDDDEYVFAILEAGAAAYLLKNARGSELIDAVRRVHAGESVLDPGVASKVLRRMTSSDTRQTGERTRPLTGRETEVLRLAARGYSNREIARELGLSPRTIQAHMANIFGKMEVASRTEAVMVGLRRGLIKLDDIPSA